MNDKELLCDFFKYFRDNGEKHIGMTIDEFVEMYLNNNQRNMDNNSQNSIK